MVMDILHQKLLWISSSHDHYCYSPPVMHPPPITVMDILRQNCRGYPPPKLSWISSTMTVVDILHHDSWISSTMTVVDILHQNCCGYPPLEVLWISTIKTVVDILHQDCRGYPPSKLSWTSSMTAMVIFNPKLLWLSSRELWWDQCLWWQWQRKSAEIYW